MKKEKKVIAIRKTLVQKDPRQGFLAELQDSEGRIQVYFNRDEYYVQGKKNLATTMFIRNCWSIGISWNRRDFLPLR